MDLVVHMFRVAGLAAMHVGARPTAESDAFFEAIASISFSNDRKLATRAFDAVIGQVEL